MRTCPKVDDGVGENGGEVRDGIRPRNERAEHAKYYYSMRDHETETSGGRSASGLHPSREQGVQHGLSQDGGPEAPEPVMSEEEQGGLCGSADDGHVHVVRLSRCPTRRIRERRMKLLTYHTRAGASSV